MVAIRKFLSQQGKVSPWANLAVISIIAAILAPILFWLPMICCGHMALYQIHQSQGKLGGRRRAIGALLLGYGFLVILFGFLIRNAAP